MPTLGFGTRYRDAFASGHAASVAAGLLADGRTANVCAVRAEALRQDAMLELERIAASP